MKGYISNSFMISGNLVNFFNLKTLRTAPRNPIPLLDAPASVLDAVLLLHHPATLFFNFWFAFCLRCFHITMASPSTYSSNSEDMEANPQVSPVAKGKRRHSEQGQASKDVRRATKKHKFQTSLEMSDKYPVTKLLLPRYIDFEDPQFCLVCSRLLDIFKFQGWMEFMSEYRVYYPRLVSEFF